MCRPERVDPRRGVAIEVSEGLPGPDATLDREAVLRALAVVDAVPVESMARIKAVAAADLLAHGLGRQCCTHRRRLLDVVSARCRRHRWGDRHCMGAGPLRAEGVGGVAARASRSEKALTVAPRRCCFARGAKVAGHASCCSCLIAKATASSSRGSGSSHADIVPMQRVQRVRHSGASVGPRSEHLADITWDAHVRATAGAECRKRTP
jgi:hypothetical protein